MKSTRRGTIPLLLAVLVIGCESATAPPQAFVGGYALSAVDGLPPPARVFATGNATVYLLGDTMVLYENGTGWQRQHSRAVLHFLEPEVEELHAWESPLRYEIRAGRLLIENVCPPNALCSAPPHAIGRLSHGGLVVTSTHPDAPRLRYERIPR